MTFSEENARQDNTEVPQGPPIVSLRPISRLKAKPAPRGEEGSVVHEKVRYTTKSNRTVTKTPADQNVTQCLSEKLLVVEGN